MAAIAAMDRSVRDVVRRSSSFRFGPLLTLRVLQLTGFLVLPESENVPPAPPAPVYNSLTYASSPSVRGGLFASREFSWY